MFPNMLEEELDQYCSYFSFDEAVNAILSEMHDSRIDSIQDFFLNLSKKLTGQVVLEIDCDFFLTDSFEFFKRTSFDPRRKLKVIFKNQPAIDAGGVRRQFFLRLFRELSNPNHVLHLFEGNPRGLLPVCRTDTAISKVFEHIGKMIGYAITHGFRPLRLSKAVYHYIIHGDIDAALPYVTISDVATGVTKHFVEEV